jgi:hypothetical protein
LRAKYAYMNDKKNGGSAVSNRKRKRIAMGLAFAIVLFSSGLVASQPAAAVATPGNRTVINFLVTNTGLVTGQAIKTVASNATGSKQETLSPSEKTSSLQYIAQIKPLLSQLKTEYTNGNYTQAEKLAVQAYLDNFENVEGPLMKANKKDLSDKIEQMMRIELREKIRDKVAADELTAFISTINDKLGEAEKVFS